MDQELVRNIRSALTADCKNCFGLCCTALNIGMSSDFPMNKPAGIPCKNLQSDYSCRIHNQLREDGYKGCTVFDCLGAGQVVSQVTFNRKSWLGNPKAANEMFQVFPIMVQIHEMIAYVAEALTYDIPSELADELEKWLKELQALAKLNTDGLLSLELATYRFKISELLMATSDFVRNNWLHKNFVDKELESFDRVRVDWTGKNLINKDLSATDFRGALLIAADMNGADLRLVNLIGADLRDANFSGANLSTSMFLTQMQVNSAKGDYKTKLPSHIHRPSHWVN